MGDDSNLEDDDAMALLASGADVLGAATAGPCPEPNELAEFVDGSCSGVRREALETHVSLCADCRSVVADLSAGAARSAPTIDEPALGGSGVESEFPRVFGPYTLLARAGRGGMGEVFVAEHRDRRRREALKQLRGDAVGDARAVERFLREVRAAARVVHEHVVPVYDSGTLDGVAYYTMPLLAGPSVAAVVDEIRAAAEPVPAAAAHAILDRHGVPADPASGRDAAAYARRCAAAVAGVAGAAASIHAAGMVHRDIKPSNLVLDDRGRAVLTDFGLVRIDASRVTRASETLGTPAYMAPEQLVQGADVDGRADVYAIGATLYEMLTLRRPHEGRTLQETVALVVRGAVRPVHSLNPEAPRDLAIVVGRCMERRPEDRYPDAATLARDLSAVSRGERVSARPLSPFVRAGRAIVRRRAWAAAAVVLLAAAATGWALLPARLSVRSAPSARVYLDGGDAGPTPLEGRGVAAGPHRVEVRCDGFATLVRDVTLARAAAYDLDVVLRAIDPADSAVLRLLAAARGIERSDVDVELTRARDPAADLAVLLPRGALREPPYEVTFWAENAMHDVTVRLERADTAAGDAPIRTWTAPNALGRSVIAIGDAERVALLPGRYRIRIASASASHVSDAAFEILSRDDARRISDEIASAASGFDSDDPAAEFLRAEVLLSRGVFVESLASAARLRQSLGDRREVARLVLASLDRAGLRDVGPWFEWASTYLRAEK